MRRALQILAMAAAVAGAPEVRADGACGQVDGQGYCTDKVVHHILRRSEPVARLKLNTALGDAVVVQLPQHAKLASQPVLGNRAIYQYELQRGEPTRILIWARAPKGLRDVSEGALLGERSNMQVELGDVSVLLDLQIAEATQSTQRVVLHFPELEAERGQAQALRQKIRLEVVAELDNRRREIDAIARRLGTRMVARDLLTRLRCVEQAERSMRDLLVARAHRLCAIGDQTFIWFEVHNRRRDTFELAVAEVMLDDGEGQAPLDALIEWRDHDTDPQLRFDEAAHGIAVFPTPEGATGYAVRVKEHGGRQRRVTVDGIEF